MTPGRDSNTNAARAHGASEGERSSTVEMRNLIKRFGRDVIAVNEIGRAHV